MKYNQLLNKLKSIYTSCSCCNTDPLKIMEDDLTQFSKKTLKLAYN